MNGEKLKIRLQQKSPIAVGISLVYLFALLLLHWRFTFPVETIIFFVGGILGLFILDIVEVFIPWEPSPFRTMVFSILLSICGIYIITSTPEIIAKGLVLSLTLTILLLEWTDWQKNGNLTSWFQFFFGEVNLSVQLAILLGTSILLLVESVIFIL